MSKGRRKFFGGFERVVTICLQLIYFLFTGAIYMIIDKAEAYRTEQDKQAIELARKEKDERLKAFDDMTFSDYMEESAALNDILQDHYLNLWRIEKSIENRYINDRTVEELIEDAIEIINAIDISDFKNFLEENKKPFSSDTVKINRTRLASSLKDETPENCRIFMTSCISTQTLALRDDDLALEKFGDCIEKRLDVLFPSNFILVAQNKALRAHDYLRVKKKHINKKTNKAIIKHNGVEFEFANVNTLRGGIVGTSTKKLYIKAREVFTKQNNFKDVRKKGQPNLEVSIPLKEYAEEVGYDPENKKDLENLRTSTNRDLEVLFQERSSWEEIPYGEKKPTNYREVRIISEKGIEQEQIKIQFTPRMGDYIVSKEIYTYVDKVLFLIDNRNATAFNLGLRLNEHYQMHNNIIRGTNDIISVASLLESSGLPNYDDIIKSNDRHWKRQIKKAFEKGLNDLTNIKTKRNSSNVSFLNSWKYTHAKKQDLTPEEKENIYKGEKSEISYKDFSELYIVFDPTNKLDHAKLIEKHKKRIEEPQTIKKRTKKNKKSTKKK